MKYIEYNTVDGGKVIRRLAETDEDRAFLHAEAMAGRTSIGDGWDRKDRERVAREMKAEEEAEARKAAKKPR